MTFPQGSSMRHAWLSLSLLCLVAVPVSAQEPDAVVPATVDDGAIRDMEAVVVTGVQPGPGLWKVHSGDRTLHILGTVSPLPTRMEWRSGQVAAVLEEAGAVLGSPGVAFGTDMGMLRSLALLPSALRATNNPDGQTLDEVLPADVHARWSALKARHIGRDRGIEKKRPMFAAGELYEKAVKRAGLRGGVVGPVVQDALKRRKMKQTPTTLRLTIEDPRDAISEFRGERLKQEDVDCFTRTMDIVEYGLPEMVARANAWAVGDVDALRSMPVESRYRACLSAWSGSEAVRKRGMTDIDQQVRAHWMEVAESSLREHAVVFATLPIAELLRPGGYLELLAAKGYGIESP